MKIIEKQFSVLPPPPDKCQVCCVDHPADYPHNKDSLYYQVTFNMQHGRSATWSDAMVHCSPEMKAFWIKALAEKGVIVEP